MSPQKPLDRKIRIIVALAGATVVLAMMGSFFFPILKDFYQQRQTGNGNHAPFFIFGGFFLVMMLLVVFSVWRGIRKGSVPEKPQVGAAGAGNVVGSILLFLFSLPFASFGIFAVVQAIRKLNAGQLESAAGLGIFGIIFSAVGFGLMTITIIGRKKWQEKKAIESRNPDKPWLWRADWAEGKIKSSVTAQSWIMLVMAVAFCGIGGVMTFTVLPKELHNGNHAVLFVLIFPLAGIGMLLAFINTWRSRLRFGDCYFELAQIPAPLGGTLEGMIQTGGRLSLEHGLHLKLSCIRRMVSGSGDNRNTTESILWQNEKVLKNDAPLPEPEPGRTGIPVFFKLPSNQPECFARGNESVIWRLEATAKMKGPNFRAGFEVPVFEIAGLNVEESEKQNADPTASMQMSVEEVRRDEKSPIRVTDGPGGREFYFPAARNFGTAIFLTLFFIVWSGFFYILLHTKAPILFPIVWGVTDVLVGIGCINLWFRSNRITIDSTSVKAATSWMFFRRSRVFDASDVECFQTKMGMTSGSKVFLDLQLITRSGKKITMAGSIPNAQEANWLAVEMNKALGRRL